MPRLPARPKTATEVMAEESPTLLDKIRAGSVSNGASFSKFECCALDITFRVLQKRVNELQSELGWIENPERMGR